MNLDDVAYLFVEQYENIHGLYSESYRPSEVDLIRRTANKGEAALYTVVATIFGDKLDEVLVGAANGAMDYIAYVDETWEPKDAEDKAKMLAMEAVHLESLEAILRMTQMNECGVSGQLEKIRTRAEIIHTLCLSESAIAALSSVSVPRHTSLLRLALTNSSGAFCTNNFCTVP